MRQRKQVIVEYHGGWHRPGASARVPRHRPASNRAFKRRTSAWSPSTRIAAPAPEIGRGYSGLEFAQAYRRFGSKITVIVSGPQLMARQDIDVSREVRRALSDEAIEVLVEAELLQVVGPPFIISKKWDPFCARFLSTQSWNRLGAVC
jgi:NAD(P)H-nitrite reductase large subunit